MYAQFSEYATDFHCIDGETRQDRIRRWSRIAENIYEAEVFESRKKNEYMGVWQILQATNCIHRPICSVYPEMFTDAFRAQLNRTFFPFNVAEREREPVYIMWTWWPSKPFCTSLKRLEIKVIANYFFTSIDSRDIEFTSASEVFLNNTEKREFLVLNQEKNSTYCVEIENVMGVDVTLDLSCDVGIQFCNL